MERRRQQDRRAGLPDRRSGGGGHGPFRYDPLTPQERRRSVPHGRVGRRRAFGNRRVDASRRDPDVPDRRDPGSRYDRPPYRRGGVADRRTPVEKITLEARIRSGKVLDVTVVEGETVVLDARQAEELVAALQAVEEAAEETLELVDAAIDLLSGPCRCEPCGEERRSGRERRRWNRSGAAERRRFDPFATGRRQANGRRS